MVKSDMTCPHCLEPYDLDFDAQPDGEAPCTACEEYLAQKAAEHEDALRHAFDEEFGYAGDDAECDEAEE